jgi:hypothetical protein
MPNDDNREMLTEVVALYLAAHMKAQAAVTTALVAILIQKEVLTDQIVRAELFGPPSKRRKHQIRTRRVLLALRQRPFCKWLIGYGSDCFHQTIGPNGPTDFRQSTGLLEDATWFVPRRRVNHSART